MITADNLNRAMEFGRIVTVTVDGSVTEYAGDDYMPEVVYLQLDSDGQSPDDNYSDVPAGWSAMSGYTGQYGYNGPTMHPSEYVGGRLARAILDNPGDYVTVAVDGFMIDENSESEPIGWAILFRATDDSKWQY